MHFDFLSVAAVLQTLFCWIAYCATCDVICYLHCVHPIYASPNYDKPVWYWKRKPKEQHKIWSWKFVYEIGETVTVIEYCCLSFLLRFLLCVCACVCFVYMRTNDVYMYMKRTANVYDTAVLLLRWLFSKRIYLLLICSRILLLPLVSFVFVCIMCVCHGYLQCLCVCV